MSSNSNIDNSKNTGKYSNVKYLNIISTNFDFYLDMLTRSYSDRSNDRNRDTNSNRERDYDGLKQQCDKAMHELVILRRY